MIKNAFHINVKKVPEADVDAIDKLVKTGNYASRSAFVREAIASKLWEEKNCPGCDACAECPDAPGRE